MTWKSTVVVSGAGLLATWLANVPAPSSTPRATVVSQPVAAPASSASDIAQLAEGLEQRNPASEHFNRPARNLFRFTPRAVARPTAVPQALPSIVVPPSPPPLEIHLSGVAMDREGEKDVWTAILSTSSGVVLAREGDAVGSGLKVARVEAESVSLSRADGSTITLPLSGK